MDSQGEGCFKLACTDREERVIPGATKDKSKKVEMQCSLNTQKSQCRYLQLQQLGTAQLQRRLVIQTVICMVKSRVVRYVGWREGTGEG